MKMTVARGPKARATCWVGAAAPIWEEPKERAEEEEEEEVGGRGGE